MSDYLTKILNINDEFKQYSSSMTDFEISKFNNEKQNLVECYGQVIEKESIQAVYDAYDTFTKEKQKLAININFALSMNYCQRFKTR